MRSLIFILLFLAAQLRANEELPNYKRSNFEGRHFYVGFMQNDFRLDNEVSPVGLRLLITTRDEAEVQIKIGDFIETITVYGDDSDPIPIPSSLEVTESGYYKEEIVEITSDNPIYVSVFNSMRLTSDIYTAIPTSRWDTEYVVMTMPCDNYIPRPDADDDTKYLQEYLRPGQFMIVAREDGTSIQIRPTVDTEIVNAGDVFETLLNKGEALYVKAKQAPKGDGDLTGTIIRSSGPVGVISGHVRSSVLPDNPDPSGGSKDHLAEMLAPVNTWGMKFVTIPWESGFDGLQNKVTSFYKVVSYYPGTIVTLEYEGEQQDLVLDNPGEHYTFQDIESPIVWRSNQPVQIAQFMGREYSTLESPYYDPCMVMIQPVEQYTNSTSFIVIPNNIFGYGHPQNVPQVQYARHHVGIVADYDAYQTMRINGVLVRQKTNFEPITGSIYYRAVLELESGNYIMETDQGKFSGVIYGNGYVDSYAHILGSSLGDPEEEDIWPPELQDIVDCYEVEGIIYDTSGTYQSGVGFLHALRDSTFNVAWEADILTDSSLFAEFRAIVIDKEKDASLVIDYRDNNGNGRRYRFKYLGRKVQVPQEIDFGEILPGIEKEEPVSIYNLSPSATVTLLDIEYDDSKLYVDLSEQLPLKMLPGDKVDHSVKLLAGNGSGINEDIKYVFDCDIEKDLMVRFLVSNPSIASEGKDYDTVLVASTKCDSVEIINNGDTRILVEKIILLEEDNFDPDTVGVFPFYLEPNESKWIDICFNPDLRSYFSSEIITIASATVNNSNEDLIDTMLVEGVGAAPLIQSLVKDWGRVRTGKTETHTLVFSNTGNYYADLRFVSIDPIKNSYVGDITLDRLSNSSSTVYPGQDLEIEIEFTPPERQVYEILSKFEIVNWDPHPEITYTSIGEGIEPLLDARSFCFDTIYVNQSVNESPILFSSIGDTTLFINEIVELNSSIIVDGVTTDIPLDEDPFNIVNLTDLDQTQIPVNESRDLEIDFNPTKEGIYVLSLAVFHDSQPLGSDPAYLRSDISICGVALDRDPPVMGVQLIGNSVFACDSTGIRAVISNNDTYDVRLESLEITSSDFHAEILNFPDLPMEIRSGQSMGIDIDVFLFRDNKGELYLKALYTDLITNSQFELYDTLYIEPQVLTLNSDPIELEQKVNEEMDLEISGTIPYDIDHWIEPEFELIVDRFYLDLRTNRTTIKFDHRGGSFDVGADVIIDQDNIKIIPDDKEIPVYEGQNWRFTLPFYTLYAREREFEFTVRISSDNCFQPFEIKNVINFEDICLYDTKQVVGSPPGTFETYPNPVRNDLNILLTVPFDDQIEITLVNALGQVLSLGEKKFVKEGNHLLNYDLISISAGNYYLIIRGNHIKEKRTIIKSN